jgi:hypothetical protein
VARTIRNIYPFNPHSIFPHPNLNFRGLFFIKFNCIHLCVCVCVWERERFFFGKRLLRSIQDFIYVDHLGCTLVDTVMYLRVAEWRFVWLAERPLASQGLCRASGTAVPNEYNLFPELCICMKLQENFLKSHIYTPVHRTAVQFPWSLPVYGLPLWSSGQSSWP